MSESIEVSLGGVDVLAVSIGGIETCIEVPDWKLCFDIGRCPASAVRRSRVCFTHPHVDHMGGVAHHASQRELYGMSPPTYLVPSTARAGFEELLAVWRRLDGSDLPALVVPVEPGQALDLGKGRRIHVFRSYHRVPTVGYALERTHERLRPELAGLSGPEIGARRARGERLTETRTEIELAFCGDTLAEVIDREPLVRTAKVLVLECTFVDPGSIERARRTGHVHLQDIADRAELFENEHLLLTHFSTRYGRSEILRRLDEVLPVDLRARVVPLLHDRSRPLPSTPPGIG